MHKHTWFEDNKTGGWECNCGQKLNFGHYNTFSRAIGPPEDNEVAGLICTECGSDRISDEISWYKCLSCGHSFDLH